MVSSSEGRVTWIKANLQPPCLRVHLLWTAKDVSRQTMGIDTMGEKQLDLDHRRGSRFPKTTIRRLARVGIPLVFLQ
jgi:hypothetical protein